MRQPISLEQIRIDSPCQMPWDEMHGDRRERFCEKCQLPVHNLSAMTSDAAEKLVGERRERVCVAYVPTATGTPVTLDYEKRRRRFTWRVTVVIGLVGAAVAAYVQALVGVAVVPPRPMIAGRLAAPGPAMVKGSVPTTMNVKANDKSGLLR